MAISCVYCGGSHDTADDVRRCWSERQAPADSPPGRVATVVETVGPRPPIALAMPALGRNIVVRPGQEIPVGWADAPVCVVGETDLRSPGEVVALLRQRADERTACVFVIADDIAAGLAAP